jgi:hypothetical protein
MLSIYCSTRRLSRPACAPAVRGFFAKPGDAQEELRCARARGKVVLELGVGGALLAAY